MTCTVCFPRNWRQITYVTLVQIHARYCWVYLWPSSSDPLIEIEGSDWTITPVWPLTPLKNTHWGRLILNCKTHLRVGENYYLLTKYRGRHMADWWWNAGNRQPRFCHRLSLICGQNMEIETATCFIIDMYLPVLCRMLILSQPQWLTPTLEIPSLSKRDICIDYTSKTAIWMDRKSEDLATRSSLRLTAVGQLIYPACSQ